ncbi:MAG TPA: 3-deoxy-D-manno-octulosonic acid transferase [Coleofasciculaceae cyanobacterium]|jgi:3-deoxy-D-manno-octulosonic-acid transferase
MGLTRILYNLLLFWGLLVLAPLWIGYLILVPKARAGFWEKLGFYPPELAKKLAPREERERIWFHAVSVGEFNAIRSLIPELREAYEVIVSTTTRTGHDLAQRTFPDLPVLYFPYDLRPAIHRAMQKVRPDLVVITETELWPNFIDVATQRYQTPLLLINGRLSRHSCKGYQWIKLLIKPCLNQITHLYMQSQADADRIGQLGDLPPEQMTVVGNLKFDLIPSLDLTRRTVLAHLLNIAEDDTVLTCASTHSGEDQFLVETYQLLRKDFPELKLVLAPRHPERAPEIKSILNSKALNYALRSQLSEENPNRQPIVVLDSIGELLTVYSLSRIAIMGGSFVEKGGQNPLEPLSQRVPVIFGPHMENFTEISRMILECRAGTQVHSQPELVNAVTELLTQPEIYDTVVETGLQLLENNRGAKEIILKAIRSYLS